MGSQRSVNTVSARLQSLTYFSRYRITSWLGDVHAVRAKRMSISRIHLLFMAANIRINQEKTKEIT